MGKIRVNDLAKMMGIPNQDLIFKLKSIGVRVEGEDAHIDTDVLQAIIQGKKLPQPREVIVRDEPAPESSGAGRAKQRIFGPQRPVGHPLRPSRPRTMIQKVEPKIKTLPATEKPERPAAREPERQPAAGARAPRPAAGEPARRPAEQAASPTPAPTGRPETDEAARPEKRTKRVKQRRVQEPQEEDLKAYRGSLKEIEVDKEEELPAPPVSARRKRRAERKKEEARTADEGKVLTFKKAPPEEPVTLSEGMTVREFADKLGIKTKDLIQVLFERGIVANINQVLEPDLAEEVAKQLGVETMVVSFEEEVQLRQEDTQARKTEGTEARAPVVTIMGHVDHGKTSLLDAIRTSKLTEAESGGITQHIGAYGVAVGERRVVFLDTPGHEAFTMLRARGAQVTDLVVLVVAADDGVMPQTLEAIDHAKAAGVPIVVALNKMDKPDANPDKVKRELGDHGLLPEDWGGVTVCVPISAVQRDGIDDLLEMILLTADLLELKADSALPAQGTIIEARKEKGRGTVATVLVQNGTLRIADVFVAGATWGRVRAMVDDLGNRIDAVGPATPVEVSGFNDMPAAGDTFQVVEEESKARSIVEFRQQQQRRASLAPVQAKLSLEQLFDKIQEGEIKELPVIIKADVQGSVEVLRDALDKLSTDQVKIHIVHAGVGAVSTNDVLLASASGAVVVGFNVRPERNSQELADQEGVDIRLHTVIYELTEEIQKAMVGLLEPELREVAKGKAEVRDTFKIPRVGTVAGCHVVEGIIPRSASARLVRDGRVIYEGGIASLKRFKDDASEVRAGYDCGIGLEKFQDVKPGDVIEAFVQEEVSPTL